MSVFERCHECPEMGAKSSLPSLRVRPARLLHPLPKDALARRAKCRTLRAVYFFAVSKNARPAIVAVSLRLLGQKRLGRQEDPTATHWGGPPASRCMTSAGRPTHLGKEAAVERFRAIPTLPNTSEYLRAAYGRALVNLQGRSSGYGRGETDTPRLSRLPFVRFWPGADWQVQAGDSSKSGHSGGRGHRRDLDPLRTFRCAPAKGLAAIQFVRLLLRCIPRA